jgi:hypothetical protein
LKSGIQIRLLTAAAMLLLPVAVMQAGTLNYTLSGVASGTIAGATNATFTDAAFSVTLSEDTSTLNGAGGYSIYQGVNAAFTEGAYSATLADVSLEVNGNGNTGSGAYETLYLFNSDFGSSLGINSDPALLGYALQTPIDTGVLTGANIGAFQDAAGFTTTIGDVIEFTGADSLEFTATDSSPVVPEPPSLALLLTGLCGAGLFAILAKQKAPRALEIPL